MLLEVFKDSGFVQKKVRDHLRRVIYPISRRSTLYTRSPWASGYWTSRRTGTPRSTRCCCGTIASIATAPSTSDGRGKCSPKPSSSRRRIQSGIGSSTSNMPSSCTDTLPARTDGATVPSSFRCAKRCCSSAFSAGRSQINHGGDPRKSRVFTSLLRQNA